ncbi:MAG: FGGY-family carbohydrate kinase [Actinomycetota bacterium]|nr:FGGY-family carbohydrate kinase [Actinomycetota bacterium]
MHEPPYILAIDLGTSGPKVALVSVDGSVIGSEFESVDLLLSPGGGAEQEPTAWWKATGKATRRALGGDPVPPGKIAAVSVTSQWSGTVAIGADGAAIGNAIIWMDSRGAPYVEELIGGPVRVQGYDPRKLRKWIKLTGGAPGGAGKDPIGHILYLRHDKPEIHAAATTFLEPKDYLNFRLTGRIAASFDSIALHWVTDNRDPRAVAYNDDLLRYVGIDRSRLPRLHPATDLLGELTAAAAIHLGLPAGVPVVVGTPDVHSAAIGAGTTSDYAAHLYIGTSSWITCHVPFKRTDLAHSIASLPAAVPERYVVANEQQTAGKALEWLAEVLYPDTDDREDVYADMNHVAAAVAPGSGGVIFTPWLFGERTPVEDATLRAGFFNQSLETGRAEMIRAVFEGVAYNSRWLLGYVEKFTKQRLAPIVMVGGGARSNLWCQIHADVLGRTIHQAEDPVLVNVRGAGLLAHAALDHISWAEIPDLVPMAATYEPNPENSATYDRLYDAFRRIHKANRRTYRKLNH